MLFKRLALVVLSSPIFASTIPKNSGTAWFGTTHDIVSRDNSAADILLKIAPTSNTCSGAQYSTECATNVQAAQYLPSAMSTYNISNTWEMAAVLSLIAFESGDFKYNIHHFPSAVAGQGTRNMQSAAYNLEYARSIPALASKVNAITTSTSASSLSADQSNQVLALVLPDQYTWASAAWFLTSQCASIRTQLQAGGTAGFTAYMGCIGASPSESGRMTYWNAATAAFGLSG